MASGPNPVSITIGGDSAPLQTAAKQAQAALTDLAGKVDGSLGTAARTTGGHLEQMKQGMGRARETAMFFTQSLGEFGPQGRTAQIAISGVTGALLGGGGLLAALSLAQVAVRLMVDAWNEEAKAEEAARKQKEETAKQEQDAALRRMGIVSSSFESYRQKNVALKAAVDGASAAAVEHAAVLSRLRSEVMLLDGAQKAAAQRRIGEMGRLFTENEQLERQIAAHKNLKELSAKQNAAEITRITAAGGGLTGGMNAAEEKYRRDAAAIGEALVALQGFNSELSLTDQIATGAMTLPGSSKERKGTAAEVWAEGWVAAADVSGSAMRGMASDVVGAFRPMLTQSLAYSRAMRAVGGEIENASDLSGPAFAAMAQNALAGLAVESAQRALFYTFEGIAMAASMNPGAAGKFAAAAGMAALAGAAGGGAYAIGQNRGMTAAERAQVEGQRESGSGSSGGGSFSSGTQGGTTTVRETVYVFAPPNMTRAEAAVFAARANEDVRRLNLGKGD